MNYSSFTTVVLVLSAWFILNRWILPWFGVPTCMCSSCSVAPRTTVTNQVNPGLPEQKYRPNEDVSE
jgi:hypothetical protein